ncbi:hypothetical protein BDQ17DRAFT_1322744 [Cyathus striatus]|nr:hypothetical protein BDQ17DRAFT_1322744 [Cyathus striatus]
MSSTKGTKHKLVNQSFGSKPREEYPSSDFEMGSQRIQKVQFGWCGRFEVLGFVAFLDTRRQEKGSSILSHACNPIHTRNELLCRQGLQTIRKAMKRKVGASTQHILQVRRTDKGLIRDYRETEATSWQGTWWRQNIGFNKKYERALPAQHRSQTNGKIHSFWSPNLRPLADAEAFQGAGFTGVLLAAGLTFYIAKRTIATKRKADLDEYRASQKQDIQLKNESASS